MALNSFFRHSHEGKQRRGKSQLVGLALMAVLVAIIYWPGLNGEWFLDDFGNIHENANVHAHSLSWDELKNAVHGRDIGHQRIDRPVAYLTLAANYALGGTDPYGYHIVNIAIHLLTAIVLYLLVRTTLNLPKLSGRFGTSAHAIALLSALLWAVHPIQVTAVTYVIQRMAAMAALFSLSALLCFVRGSIAMAFTRKAVWYFPALLLGLLAFWSKQNAVMLPVSIALYAWVFLSPESDDRARKRRWLWMAAAVVLVVIVAGANINIDTLLDGYKERPFTLAERVLTQFRVFWFYLWLLVYPISSQYTLLHDFPLSTGVMAPWTTGPAIIMLLIVAMIAVRSRHKYPLLSFGMLFFLVNHAVESTILPLELVFEHRNYLPSVFLLVSAASGILSVVDHFKDSPIVQKMAIACVVLVIIAAGHTTYLRNTLFTSRIALWGQNVSASPELHRPRHNLGRALFDAGDVVGAEVEMKKALAGKSGARKAQKLVTYYNLGLLYRAIGDVDAAARAFGTVVANAGRHEGAWYQLAYIALDENLPEKARELANRAASVGEKGYQYHVVMGLAAMENGDVETARQHSRMAINMPWEDSMLYCLIWQISVAIEKPVQEAYFRKGCPFTYDRSVGSGVYPRPGVFGGPKHGRWGLPRD